MECEVSPKTELPTSSNSIDDQYSQKVPTSSTKAADRPDSRGNNSELVIQHIVIRGRAISYEDIVEKANEILCSSSNKFSIEFRGCGLTANHLRCFCDNIKDANCQITSLAISYMDNIDELLESICFIVWKYETTSLRLEYDDMNDESIKLFQYHLKSAEIKSLNHLDISYNDDVSASGFRQLGRVLMKSSIVSFKATDCNVTDEKLENLLNTLQSGKLKELDIGRNKKLTNEGFQILAKFVASKGVERLRLSGCELSKANIDAFHEVISQTGHKPLLQELDVSYNSTMDPDTSLGSVVESCGVTKLSMAGCKLKKDHFACFRKSVKEHKIYLVNMRNNTFIEKEGIAEIAQLVKQCEVKELNICDCMFSSRDLKCFRKALAGMQVSRLHLGDQNREPDGRYIDELCALLTNVKDVLFLRFHKLSNDFRTTLQNNCMNSTKINLIVGGELDTSGPMEKKELPTSTNIEARETKDSEDADSKDLAVGSMALEDEKSLTSESDDSEDADSKDLAVGSMALEDEKYLTSESDDQRSQPEEVSSMSSESLHGEMLLDEELPTLSKSFEHQTSHGLPQERLEDIFQEIIKAFVKMDDFKMFARSNRGLCLDESDIQHIIENNIDSVADQKMAMLNKWKEIEGEEATARKIRSLATGYKMGTNPDDYISLLKNMFGLFRNEPLSKRGHVFLGEQFSDLLGRKLRAIKLAPYNDENLREAKILTELGTHENIVSTIHADTYHARPMKYIFIVMELYYRTSLREIFGISTLEKHTALNFAIKTMKPLAFIHEHNILHRDLKPENILVSDDLKQLKLTDFGISKAMTDGYQTKQTNADTGTEGYRARETYDKEKKITVKSDIFSAGVTLAEIFSNGKHPYGNNPHLLSSNIINKKKPDLSQVFVIKKPQPQKLLRGMLDPEPGKRPLAEKVLNDLKLLEKTQAANQPSTSGHKRQTTAAEELTAKIPKDFAQACDNQSDQPSTSLGFYEDMWRYMRSPWREALKKEFDKPYFKQLNSFIMDERARYQVYPPHDDVFAWAQCCEIEKIKVVIVGDQPYSTPGLANGLSFSAYPLNPWPVTRPLPQSLQNIFTELQRDIPGFKRPDHGNLSGWAEQGVLLLNSVLTVREGSPDSHINKGWEQFTDAVIKLICRKRTGDVFMLWGDRAQKKKHLICTAPHCTYTGGGVLCSHPTLSSESVFTGYGERNCKRRHCIPNYPGSYPLEPQYMLIAPDPSEWNHSTFMQPPQPMSSDQLWGNPPLRRGPFSQANEILKRQGKTMIDWNQTLRVLL